MKRNKAFKVISVFLIVALTFIALYKYGYKIPVLKRIPFFSTGHEHQYRPVFTKEGEIDYWTCTMHPSVRLKEPGTCPICGMDLVPVMKKGSAKEKPSQEMKDKENMKGMQGMEGMKGMEGMQGMEGMEGMEKSKGDELKSTFTVSPERQQIIGVKTEPVTVRPMKKLIRAVGLIELNETKIAYVSTKVNGWIDKVFADYTFKYVKLGQPLFSIYSPELVSTQEEYLLALRSRKILDDNQFPEIAGGANSLVESTRRRLRLWDISPGQIRELERTGKAKKSLIIYSPVAGHITEKNVFENMYVEPNTKVYMIADHSTVWVNADIYENEISLVKTGQTATMTVNSFPGEEFKGKVAFILPHVMPETRTVKVRIEFPNPALKLFPGMYTNIELEMPMGEKLTVTETAVLRTGKQDVVFVDKGEGNMEIRKVELGNKSDGYYEVLRGLKEGDNVVSRANFLIDAESKVQAAVATWGEESGNNEPMPKMESDKENQAAPEMESH